MRKLLLVLSLALSVSAFSQQYDTHWPYNTSAYTTSATVVAFIQIDGEYVTSDDNWAVLEGGSFVNGETRGHYFMDYDASYGDPYPSIPIPVSYNNEGEPVTFKLYNHETEIEYENYVCNIDNILTGDWHDEIWAGNY